MADSLNAKELKAFLERFDAVAAELARSARELVLDVFPDAMETAERKEIGSGSIEGTRGWCSLCRSSGLNFGIAEGATMSDPDGLIGGAGKRHRHHPVVDVVELSNPALRGLLERTLESRRSVTGS